MHQAALSGRGPSPSAYFFNRDWYERFDGRAELDEQQAAYRRLNADEKRELLDLLSSCDPSDFVHLRDRASTGGLKNVLQFYVPLSKHQLYRIWAKQKALTLSEPPPDIGLADDERVEDAGLDEDETFSQAAPALKAFLQRERMTV